MKTGGQILLHVHLLLDGARRVRLRNTGITELGILTESLIHSDSFDTRRETLPVQPLKED